MSRRSFRVLVPALVVLAAPTGRALATPGGDLDAAFYGCDTSQWDDYVKYRDLALKADPEIANSKEARQNGHLPAEWLKHCDDKMAVETKASKNDADSSLSADAAGELGMLVDFCPRADIQSENGLKQMADKMAAWKKKKEAFLKKYPDAPKKSVTIKGERVTVPAMIARCEDAASKSLSGTKADLAAERKAQADQLEKERKEAAVRAAEARKLAADIQKAIGGARLKIFKERGMPSATSSDFVEAAAIAKADRWTYTVLRTESATVHTSTGRQFEVREDNVPCIVNYHFSGNSLASQDSSGCK